MWIASFQLILYPFQYTNSTVISGSSVRFNQFSKFILESQQAIIKQLEDEDGKAQFCQDNWQKGESVRFQRFTIPTRYDFNTAGEVQFSGSDSFIGPYDANAKNYFACVHDR